MRLRSLAAGVAVTAGAAGLANAALQRQTDELEPPLDGTTRAFDWNGLSVQYTEAGDPDDQDLVFLHGINAAGSSGEFRAVFDDLAEEYHVIAPDLPGFGTSDRPPLRYSATLYEEFVRDFVSTFDQPAVVVSSLTSAYLVAADDLDLSAVVAICPTPRGGPDPNLFARELLRSPLVGEALFNLLASKPSIRYFNADHGYYDPDSVSESWTDYEWRTAHQPNARYAPASFISGFLNSEIDLGAALAALDAPVTLVWGREADITPLSQGRELAEAGDCRLVVIDDSKLLPHVEFPAAFVDIVLDTVE